MPFFLRLTYGHIMPGMSPPAPSVDRVLRHFAERTTMHGVPRIINAHSLPARIFWALICIGAFTMFFWQTAILMERYLSYPKKVNMEIIQKPVPFPSVTVCNTDHLDIEVVDIAGDVIGIEEMQNKSIHPRLQRFKEAYGKYFTEATSFVNIDIMSNGQSDETMRHILEINSRLGLTANLGPELASQAGVRLEDFIMSCQFMTNECIVNGSFSKVFDPYYYNCFTFEPESILPTRNTRIQGIEYGLSLLLFTGSAGQFVVNDDNEMPMFVIPGFMESNLALSSGQGARVVIHSPGTRPHPTYDGFDIAPGKSITIGVKGRENVRIGPPHGNCTPEFHSVAKNTNFTYTLMECQNKCIQNKIKQACGCFDSHMTDVSEIGDTFNKTDYCLKLPKFEMYCIEGFPDDKCAKTVSNWKSKFVCVKETYDNLTMREPGSMDDCKCYPPCEDIVYDTSYSLSRLPDMESKEASRYSVAIAGFFENKLPERKLQILEQKYGEHFRTVVHEQVSRLNVHIADSNIIKTIEQPDYEGIRLVSDIGGQLGLWIGISVITLFEVLQLLVDLIHFVTAKGRSVTERKANGPADMSQSSMRSHDSFRNHSIIDHRSNEGQTALQYWDHRYSFKDIKPDSIFECDKLTTV